MREVTDTPFLGNPPGTLVGSATHGRNLDCFWWELDGAGGLDESYLQLTFFFTGVAATYFPYGSLQGQEQSRIELGQSQDTG